MKYQSKKDPEIYASYDFADDHKNVFMIYLTGEKAGKSFSVTESTLKRWWRKVKDETVNDEAETVVEKTDDNPLGIDFEQVNQPYPEPKEQKYIPKPQSVIEYEENKKRKRYNGDVPSFETICDDLGEYCDKINDKSQYIRFAFDKATTLWRKSGFLSLYTTQALMELLTEKGIKVAPNKDKARPFAYPKIISKEEYDTVVDCVKQLSNKEE